MATDTERFNFFIDDGQRDNATPGGRDTVHYRELKPNGDIKRGANDDLICQLITSGAGTAGENRDEPKWGGTRATFEQQSGRIIFAEWRKKSGQGIADAFGAMVEMKFFGPERQDVFTEQMNLDQSVNTITKHALELLRAGTIQPVHVRAMFEAKSRFLLPGIHHDLHRGDDKHQDGLRLAENNIAELAECSRMANICREAGRNSEQLIAQMEKTIGSHEPGR